ncbi:YceI family protein [Candidatus Poribacteria bacterium]|nr:YceI family protein [Candidatus Poribacteria bacterium]
MKRSVFPRFAAAFGAAAILASVAWAQNGAGNAAPAAKTFVVDPVHSGVMFRLQHMGVGYFHGNFEDISGTIVWDEADPAKSSIQIAVNPASLDTNNKGRDEHASSPDYLDTKKFTTSTFASTSIRKVSGSIYEAAGDFTLHGVTKPITFQFEHVGSAEDRSGGLRTGAEAVFTIKRSDYGIGQPAGLGDEIRLTVFIEAVQPSEKKPE